jgi:hypothetical protein
VRRSELAAREELTNSVVLAVGGPGNAVLRGVTAQVSGVLPAEGAAGIDEHFSSSSFTVNLGSDAGISEWRRR